MGINLAYDSVAAECQLATLRAVKICVGKRETRDHDRERPSGQGFLARPRQGRIGRYGEPHQVRTNLIIGIDNCAADRHCIGTEVYDAPLSVEEVGVHMNALAWKHGVCVVDAADMAVKAPVPRPLSRFIAGPASTSGSMGAELDSTRIGSSRIADKHC
jgi:hypothetical protein